MIVFNENLTEIITDYDLQKGILKETIIYDETVIDKFKLYEDKNYEYDTEKAEGFIQVYRYVLCKVFDETKTQVIESPDFKKGYVKQDTLIVKIIPATEEVQEQGHWETIMEYPNGGKDVEWVVDVEGQPAKPETYECEDILVYVPFTKEELTQNEIYELEDRLNQLTQDFIQIQCGAVFEDADERITEFQDKHNRLRYLKGKQPRVYK